MLTFMSYLPLLAYSYNCLSLFILFSMIFILSAVWSLGGGLIIISLLLLIMLLVLVVGAVALLLSFSEETWRDVYIIAVSLAFIVSFILTAMSLICITVDYFGTVAYCYSEKILIITPDGYAHWMDINVPSSSESSEGGDLVEMEAMQIQEAMQIEEVVPIEEAIPFEEVIPVKKAISIEEPASNSNKQLSFLDVTVALGMHVVGGGIGYPIYLFINWLAHYFKKED